MRDGDGDGAELAEKDRIVDPKTFIEKAVFSPRRKGRKEKRYSWIKTFASFAVPNSGSYVRLPLTYPRNSAFTPLEDSYF
jgi:hypothetical protein